MNSYVRGPACIHGKCNSTVTYTLDLYIIIYITKLAHRHACRYQSYGAPSVSAILIAKLTFDVVCLVSFTTENFSPHDIIENNIWILPFWSLIYIADK